MKTRIDFEAWAKLLIVRKVPENFSHLIDSTVIDSGADILKRGDAFEVHLKGAPIQCNSETARLLVTPLS